MIPVTPPATIGMLGGGQLGRYALIAAASMGYRTLVLDPDPSAPAGVVSNEHLVAAYDDPHALRRMTLECDLVTTEFENPPAATLEFLASSTVVAPRPASVAIAQDRIAEKRFLTDNGFPVAPYVELPDARDEVVVADAVLGRLFESPSANTMSGPSSDSPCGAVVKTARLGYDGKGQVRVADVTALHAAWAELGGVACVAESLLDLETELSVLVGRTADGRVESWAVTENEHVGGILDVSTVPSSADASLVDRASGLGMAVADALDFVGVLAVEMFVVGDRLLINEIAPRPHNSGHWTLDASVTSQFEQQIRAACGLGLGDTSMTAPAVAMVNLLGDLWFTDGSDRPVEPAWAVALADPSATLHLYGKSVPRRGRKMGHLTVTAPTAAVARRLALEMRDELLRRPADDITI